jgi:DNA-binding NtrC family response regulator
MQPMDGWVTLSSIKNNPVTADVPVAMFSGKSPTMEEIERYGGWMEDYLMKPMKFSEISETLAAILDRCVSMRSERERMAALCTEPGIIGECGGLTRSIFIRKKFSLICYQDTEGCDQDIRRLEDRFRQLTPGPAKIKNPRACREPF